MKFTRIAKIGIVLIALLAVAPWVANRLINNDGVAEQAKKFAIDYADEMSGEKGVDAEVIRRTVVDGEGGRPEVREYVISLRCVGSGRKTVTVVAQKQDKNRYSFYVDDS